MSIEIIVGLSLLVLVLLGFGLVLLDRNQNALKKELNILKEEVAQLKLTGITCECTPSEDAYFKCGMSCTNKT